MKKLQNIKKAMSEIVFKLASNAEIQKLLLVDSPDIKNSSFTPIPQQEMLDKNYIMMAPQNDVAITDNSKNTFLVAAIMSIQFKEDGNHDIDAVIYVATNIEHALINNNEDRALAIADEIVNILDNLKLSCATSIKCDNIARMAYSEFYSGYEILFSFADYTAGEYQL